MDRFEHAFGDWVMLHFLFILFVMLGGLLVLRYRWVAWLHVPAAVWGAVVELAGWLCPLTPWEISLRLRAGEVGYETGFIEHYLIPLIYPPGLTRQLQIAIGAGVVTLNLGIYLWIWHRRLGRSKPP